MASDEIEKEEGGGSHEIPDEVRAAIDTLLDSGEPLRVAVETDITLSGKYGSTWLLATDRRLMSLTPNGHEGPHLVEVPLNRVTGVDLRETFGCGTLKVRTERDGTTLALFSKSQLQAVSDAAAQIEDLVNASQPERDDGRILRSTLHKAAVRRKRCDACGNVIPHRMRGVCPACLDKRKLLARLLGHTKPYWLIASASLLILLAATFIGLTPPLLMRSLIDDVLAPASRDRFGIVTPTPGSETRLPAGNPDSQPFDSSSGVETLGVLVFLLLLINVSRNGLGAIRSYIMARLGQLITFDLRRQVYRHLHLLSLSFYNERETGQIMASITQDVSRLQDFLSDGLQEAIRNVLTVLIICGILFTLNAGLAVFVLLPTPLIILVTIHFGKRLHTVYHALWRRWAKISALLADVIPGVRVVKAFAQENREVDRFEVRSEDLLTGELRAARIRSVFSPTMTFLTSLGTLVIWWVGGKKVLSGTLTLGDFVAFTGYMWQFYGPVESLCRLNQRFQRAATSAERVFEVLDTQPDVADHHDAVDMPVIEGRVEFRNVNFAYEPGKPALRDLSFVIEPGEMIGLAGHSGAGKSTLINMICRFYDVEEGAILIDGQDIRDVTLKSLRDQIGVVLQEPFLFNGTVAENIAYGNPDAPLESIVAAARAANAYDFIFDMPDGFDTILGERGVRMSGGERQRVSIARAILRDPRILILDEATASMDTETESHIQQALERLVKGRTTFAIAHRLSTLKHSNRLLIIEKGKLEEIGTHDELIEKDGIYAKLVSMQQEMSKIRAV